MSVCPNNGTERIKTQCVQGGAWCEGRAAAAYMEAIIVLDTAIHVSIPDSWTIAACHSPLLCLPVSHLITSNKGHLN